MHNRFKNRNYIISGAYINSASKTILSRLLVFVINILDKWCQDNDLDGGTIISKTETCYANDDKALQKLQHFIDSI